jgi:hypothetical protein
LTFFSAIFFCHFFCHFTFSEYPNNDPGTDSVPFDRYEKIFEGKANSPDINKNTSRDVCGKSIRVRQGLSFFIILDLGWK